MTFTLRATDFERPDGLVERRAKWRDLGVGMTLWMGGRKWTIVDSAIPEQFGYGRSLWFRFQAPQGEIVNYPPQLLSRNCTLLIDPKDDTVLEPTLPANHEQVALLVKELGAEEIATQDRATGEIWCPNYAAGYGHLTEVGGGTLGRQELYHMTVAHGIDVGGIEAIVDHAVRLAKIAHVHGDLHEGRIKSVGGFAHRHVPEDLSILG